MKKIQCKIKAQRKLSTAIKLACGATGFLMVLSLPLNGSAEQIVRGSEHAFGIPDDIISRIAVGPAPVNIGGEQYLQFILHQSDPTDGDTIESDYESLIVGPFKSLLNRTIPWDDLIYAEHEITINITDSCTELSDDTCPLTPETTALVDLDGDGAPELFYDNQLYDLSPSPVLITDQLLGPDYNSSCYGPESYKCEKKFIDIDQDGDLDFMNHSVWKQCEYCEYSNIDTDYYENIGAAAAPLFVERDVGWWTLHEDSATAVLRPGVSKSQIVADVDRDDDLDKIKITFDKWYNGESEHHLEYFENVGQPRKTPLFVTPFAPVPIHIDWITDFDTDGDLDILQKVSGTDQLAYHENNGRPFHYKPPVLISGFPMEDFFSKPVKRHAMKGSQLRSPEIFADLDGDGLQEMLVQSSRGDDGYDLYLLRKQPDNTFEKILLFHNDEESSSRCSLGCDALQFIDADLDGDLDVAHRSAPDGMIHYMEQVTPLNFRPMRLLASDALNLMGELARDDISIDFDIDGDGDQDTLFKEAYTSRYDEDYGLTSIAVNTTNHPGTITNFSTRSYVGTGANILIGGFIIEGESPQTVIIRGLGPSLSANGVAVPLSDPKLSLFSGQTLIAHNDDWASAKGADAIVTAGIAPTHPKEAALRVRLNPGAYTVHLHGDSNGVGIVAVDADNQMPTNSMQVNISGRALVKGGENLIIGGFIVEGDTPVKVLIRGLGPSLADKGVPNPLKNPALTLFSGSEPIAVNDDWQQAAEASGIAELKSAPTHAKEAAILTELNPGAYTVHLRDSGGASGVGIIAIDRP